MSAVRISAVAAHRAVGLLAHRHLPLVHHDPGGLTGTVLLSLASAAVYGLAAVLQHQAAVREAPELSMRTRLLVRLARRPRWLVGNLLDVVGYGCQFLALRRGSLPLVEPLLVLSLVFALPVAARLDHRRVSATDLSLAGLVVAGLALFLGLARPGAGHPHASPLAWATLAAAIAVSCGASVLAARRWPRRRAVLLAAGSGIAFGYVAAVTERTGHLLDAGVAHTLASWEPYALVAAAAVALLLTQSAFHTGALRLSLPTLTVAQPVVAVVIGVVVFGERLHGRGVAVAVEALGMVVAAVGVFALARSPAMGLEEQR